MELEQQGGTRAKMSEEVAGVCAGNRRTPRPRGRLLRRLRAHAKAEDFTPRIAQGAEDLLHVGGARTIVQPRERTNLTRSCKSTSSWVPTSSGGDSTTSSHGASDARTACATSLSAASGLSSATATTSQPLDVTKREAAGETTTVRSPGNACRALATKD